MNLGALHRSWWVDGRLQPFAHRRLGEDFAHERTGRTRVFDSPRFVPVKVENQ
jgi:hypothetical protein